MVQPRPLPQPMGTHFSKSHKLTPQKCGPAPCPSPMKSTPPPHWIPPQEGCSHSREVRKDAERLRQVHFTANSEENNEPYCRYRHRDPQFLHPRTLDQFHTNRKIEQEVPVQGPLPPAPPLELAHSCMSINDRQSQPIVTRQQTNLPLKDGNLLILLGHLILLLLNPLHHHHQLSILHLYRPLLTLLHILLDLR